MHLITRSIEKVQLWTRRFWNMKSYWRKGINVRFKNKPKLDKWGVGLAGVAEVVASLGRWATLQAKPKIINTKRLFRLRLKVRENRNNRSQVKSWSQRRRDREVKVAWEVQSLKPLIRKRHCQDILRHRRIVAEWSPSMTISRCCRAKML